jgi:hypothetical protein
VKWKIKMTIVTDNYADSSPDPNAKYIRSIGYKGNITHQYWDDNNQYHREDGPAVEIENVGKMWFNHGVEHREDGPAVELADGTQRWFVNGKLHREDGPALVYAHGRLVWYKNGEFVRENRPALHTMRLAS